MNSIKNFKTGLFLGIFSLFFAFSFGQGLALTKVAFAQEPPTEAEKVQTFYSEKDLKQYKISSLKRFYLNFQLKFAPGPATYRALLVVRDPQSADMKLSEIVFPRTIPPARLM